MLITALEMALWRYLETTFDFGVILSVLPVGGLLIETIGLNLLKVVYVRIENLLPSIITVVLVYYIYHLFYKHTRRFHLGKRLFLVLTRKGVSLIGWYSILRGYDGWCFKTIS